ncbi:MAG: hypothetical protein J6Y83_05675 [Bacteroidales bacterium]|nr:hypothetical protein [Bacteroidales bacterium]
MSRLFDNMIIVVMLLAVCLPAEAQSEGSSARGGRDSWTSVYEYCRDSIYRVRNPQGKLDAIRENNTNAGISLTNESQLPDLEYRSKMKDTLQILDIYGRQTFLMKAVRDDETGEMLANEVLDAAVVSARFRNVAERNGKVAIRFDILVPHSMMDNKWQLRFDPDLYILDDSVRLAPVIITGEGYRKAQLRGYQQYERFLSRIVSDTTAFINIRQLELFIERNIPQLYAFKKDSSEVSDELFYSYYGISEAKAVEHYTNKLARKRNHYRMLMKQRMYEKYVKAPIVTEGIRLDTVLVDMNGDFTYCYSQQIDTRPKLRKVDIVLSGAIYEQEKKLYSIPRGEPLSFYISSVSMFADQTERYLTKVVERKVSASASYDIVFQVAKADVRSDLAGNAEEIGNIKQQLVSLIGNEVFELDSIRVTATASPEGKYRQNEKLSQRRSESVSKYFRSWMRHYRDSLESARGFSVDENGRMVKESVPEIAFQSDIYAENWKGLDELVGTDVNLSEEDKRNYYSLAEIEDSDDRESRMKQQAYYKYLKDELYPKLRTVSFDFYLHRKSMAKDTVHTTVLDTVYMQGVEAIRERDYEVALMLLAPYQDYNTAVAYVALDRNRSALDILSKCEQTAQVNYLLALLYSRLGDETKAVQHYMTSCSQDQSFVHRGNLDPEISALIALYGLNKREDEDIY